MTFLFNTPDNAEYAFIFAHGAGAPMDSPFMNRMASHLEEQGVAVIRFEFPYMQERREMGKKRPPNPIAVLEEYYSDVISDRVQALNVPVFIGGKSMGGRVASLVAAHSNLHDSVCGVICFGYPFHPPGKQEKLRIDHMGELKVPQCIFQGTRDPFGKPQEVEGYSLPANVEVHWQDSGDHDLLPTKRSGVTQEQIIGRVAGLSRSFMERCCK